MQTRTLYPLLSRVVSQVSIVVILVVQLSPEMWVVEEVQRTELSMLIVRTMVRLCLLWKWWIKGEPTSVAIP